jgi:hypothetical protein
MDAYKNRVGFAVDNGYGSLAEIPVFHIFHERKRLFKTPRISGGRRFASAFKSLRGFEMGLNQSQRFAESGGVFSLET